MIVVPSHLAPLHNYTRTASLLTLAYFIYGDGIAILRRCAEVSAAALRHCGSSEDNDRRPPPTRSTLNYDYFSMT